MTGHRKPVNSPYWSRMADYTWRGVELLSDGEWHNLEAIYAEAGKLITPGQAIREYQKTAQKGRAYKGLGPDLVYRPLTTQEQITSGKRTMLRAAFGAKSYFEFDPPKGRPGGRRPVDRGRRIRYVGPPVPPRPKAEPKPSPALIVKQLEAAEPEERPAILRGLLYDDLEAVTLELVRQVTEEWD